ncbi:reverse transcriptase domain-containing protein, partial [Tanacetum coccineum]
EPWLLHKFDEDFYGEELHLVVVVGYIRPEFDTSCMVNNSVMRWQWLKVEDTDGNVVSLPNMSGIVQTILPDTIPKTIDEMLRSVDDYVDSEEAFRNTAIPKGEFQKKEAWDSGRQGVTSNSGVYGGGTPTDEHQDHSAGVKNVITPYVVPTVEY